jgi:hypothetical protein
MAEYRDSDTVELTGVVTRVRWANPHVQLKLLVRDDAGDEASWSLEGFPRSQLERSGVPNNAVAVGDAVTVAGDTSSRRERTMLVRNILLADRTELLIGYFSKPHWPQATRIIGGNVELLDEAEVRASKVTARGIFRVWTQPFGVRGQWSGDFPLTDSAQARQATFDVVRDDPYANCTPPGMPSTIMGNAWPIEFVDGEEVITLRMEAFGLSRVIHIGGEDSPEALPATPLGYSVGNWDNGSLVVRTNRIDYPYFDTGSGTPQSPIIELTERFTVSEDETELHYAITATDPETFTGPVAGSKRWVWTPGLDLAPYECVSDE